VNGFIDWFLQKMPGPDPHSKPETLHTQTSKASPIVRVAVNEKRYVPHKKNRYAINGGAIQTLRKP